MKFLYSYFSILNSSKVYFTVPVQIGGHSYGLFLTYKRVFVWMTRFFIISNARYFFQHTVLYGTVVLEYNNLFLSSFCAFRNKTLRFVLYIYVPECLVLVAYKDGCWLSFNLPAWPTLLVLIPSKCKFRLFECFLIPFLLTNVFLHKSRSISMGIFHKKKKWFLRSEVQYWCNWPRS